MALPTHMMKKGNVTLTRFINGRALSTSTALKPENVANTMDEKNVTVLNHLNPLEHKDYFNVRNSFTLNDLFLNRVHYGHKSIVRNEYMKPFLFGNRLGIDIIDLDQTVQLLGDALNFTAHVAFRQGIIMFVTRSPQNITTVEQMAKDCGEYSHCRKWRLGTFTNSTVQYGATTRLPDLCIFLSTLNDAFEQHTAVVESAKMNIPVIGIVDSNCDPRLITFPVPGNDDTPCAIKLYMSLFTDAIKKGKHAHASMNINVEAKNSN
ncbi:hypothetical protein HELRODRAFT_167266 [Helobdella robusta]|uniref:Small ribosomal subunit protein uS2m n=1 Tax=Helobdella robusta TaxID=6412 RepID=T1EZ70_HELRO|nr:hypothetical protein HELRODRAFT_167266 [Helobdella robusta]ESO10768.1 hypothetical protein HELRODRAFT_167266 [Helobdella robusta]